MMRKWYLMLLGLVLLGGCSHQDRKIAGSWRIVAVQPPAGDTSEAALAAWMWLHVRSDSIRLRFHQDSVWSQGTFYGRYHREGRALVMVRPGEGAARSGEERLEVRFQHDTLILQQPEEGAALRLVRPYK